MPVSQRCCEENLGVPRSIASFVLPLGATLNSDGTALYEAIAAIFVSSLYGIDLGLGGQLVVVIVSIATAIGAPGIPSAGMVTMIVVLEAVGLPGEAVGLLLTIDRFLDTFRTVANVEGDAIVAVIVARQAQAPEARLYIAASSTRAGCASRSSAMRISFTFAKRERERGGTGSPESIFMRSGST